MKWKDKYEAQIKRIIKQVMGLSSPDDGALLPTVIIKGTGYLWCYAPLKNKFLRVSRGTTAYIIDKKEDNKGRILIYTTWADLILIKAHEVTPAGFN